MAERIGAETLLGWMREGRDMALVDTLPPTAFAKAHLPGAMHIMSDDILSLAASRLPDRDRVIVVYCGSETCKRAGLAAARLERLGYTQVHHFSGGKRAWREAEFALEGEGEQDAG